MTILCYMLDHSLKVDLEHPSSMCSFNSRLPHVSEQLLQYVFSVLFSTISTLMLQLCVVTKSIELSSVYCNKIIFILSLVNNLIKKDIKNFKCAPLKLMSERIKFLSKISFLLKAEHCSPMTSYCISTRQILLLYLLTSVVSFDVLTGCY